MKISRHFTDAKTDVYEGITFAARQSQIRHLSGAKLSDSVDFFAPESWSQVACDILAQKYTVEGIELQ